VVNINDIATSGAIPRWLLTSLLFPIGTTALQVKQVMKELKEAAQQQDLILCGGHTEITDAVNRPVVVTQAVGTVGSGGLIEKKNMREGDRILLTKGIAVEGTCIIAREFPGLLSDLGLSEAEVEKCRNLLDRPGISILGEAQIAAGSGAVTAMHDITEGGLATALMELSIAGKRRLRVFSDRIPILEETKKVCGLLKLDPLGLIGSGSLLICCAPESAGGLIQSIREAGIEAKDIGEVLKDGLGIEAFDKEDGQGISWPHFEVDEIARLFQERSPEK
jgi:hydrogenase maturation factor